MSNLFKAVSRYLASTGGTASTLERDAHLANGFLTKVRAGSKPSTKSLVSILSAVPREHATGMLRAHLLDCTPEQWRDHTHINITCPAAHRPLTTRTTLDINAPDAYDRALEILAASTSPKVRKHILSFVRDFVT